jgi:hypothetical protein
VYAIGGNEGRNEQSARLMGLPVDRVKLTVYTFNGFCSALAGLAFSAFVFSGHGLYAPGFELDVIASVVMGGTMLTGGAGYVFGTLFGVMVLAVTQALIQFIGSLSSWWTRIVIGVLTLVFIGVQTILANRKEARKVARSPQVMKAMRLQQLKVGLGIGVVVLALYTGVRVISNIDWVLPSEVGTGGKTTENCVVVPFREEEAAELIKGGAVIAYHRTAGPDCVDELFAIYPDGKIVGENGASQKVETQVDPAKLEEVLTAISVEHRWFTDEVFSTYLTPCAQCYAHYVDISYNGQAKAVTGVDGTTAAPPGYLFSLSVIRPLLPKFEPAP